MAGRMDSRRLFATVSATISGFSSTLMSSFRHGMAASWAAPLSVGAAVSLGSQRPSHISHSSSLVSARARSRLTL